MIHTLKFGNLGDHLNKNECQANPSVRSIKWFKTMTRIQYLNHAIFLITNLGQTHTNLLRLWGIRIGYIYKEGVFAPYPNFEWATLGHHHLCHVCLNRKHRSYRCLLPRHTKKPIHFDGQHCSYSANIYMYTSMRFPMFHINILYFAWYWYIVMLSYWSISFVAADLALVYSRL